MERGRYFAFMTGARIYDLYRLDQNSRTLERVLESQPTRSVFEPMPPDADLRYPSLRNGLSALQFGEVWEANLNFAQSGGTGTADAYLGNSGGGVVRPFLTGEEVEEDVWTIMFISRRNFEVRRRSRPNEPPRIGSIADGWTSEDGTLRMEALSGKKPFEPGDAIRFETRHVGALNAMAPRLGTFAVFHTTDESAPEISFAVEGQDFADGDAVSPTPGHRGCRIGRQRRRPAGCVALLDARRAARPADRRLRSALSYGARFQQAAHQLRADTGAGKLSAQSVRCRPGRKRSERRDTF